MKLFKSKIFLRYFLSYLFIICITFLAVSFLLLPFARTSILFPVAILALEALLAFFLSRWLSNPIQELTSQVKNSTTHNYQSPICMTTNTELDILVDSFNNMQSIINARKEELKNLNEELKIQAEAAMNVDRLKEEFLANMSHELKTPLNSIIGFTARVIKKSTDVIDPTQLENLMIVEEQAKHLLNIIDNLLDYSIIQAGKMEVNAESFNMVEVINDAYNSVRNLADEKNIQYKQRLFSSTYIPVTSDKVKIKQILINLLSNAFKYSEHGTVTLSVDMKDTCYYIKVEDQGVGISPENLQSIFDSFRQLDGSYTRKVGGTGLGLTITRSFAQMLGGSIEVTSTPDVGSCFTLHIPVKYRQY